MVKFAMNLESSWGNNMNTSNLNDVLKDLVKDTSFHMTYRRIHMIDKSEL